MGYVEKALVSGESVRHRGHFHWMQRVSAYIWLIVAIGLIMLIRMWTTEIAITNRRLIYKRGWIARKTDEISLKRIEEVNLKQGIGGRVLGYGKVTVHGMGGGDIALPTIGSPLEFKRELQAAQARAEE